MRGSRATTRVSSGSDEGEGWDRPWPRTASEHGQVDGAPAAVMSQLGPGQRSPQRSTLFSNQVTESKESPQADFLRAQASLAVIHVGVLSVDGPDPRPLSLAETLLQ